MKKLLIVTLVLIFGVVAAQLAEQAAMNEQAMMRVAHLAPGVPMVEVTIGGEPAFEALGFRSVSGYQPVPSGTVEITVVAEGEEAASESHDFEAGSHYTLVVLHGVAEAVEEPVETAQEAADEVPEEEGEVAEEEGEVPEEEAEIAEEEAEIAEEEVGVGLQVFIFTDEVTAPPGEGEALVRVLHAYDEAREEGVDLAPFGPEEAQEAVREVVLGVHYSEVSNYFPVAADAGFEIRLIESGGAVAEAEPGAFEPGRIYTIILTQDEEGLPDIIIQEDDIMVEEAEAEPTAEEPAVAETEVEAVAMETHSWAGNEAFTTEAFEASGAWEITLGAWCYDGISFVRVDAYNQDGEEVGEVTVIREGVESVVLDTEPGMYYLEVSSPNMDVYSWELVVQPVGAD